MLLIAGWAFLIASPTFSIPVKSIGSVEDKFLEASAMQDIASAYLLNISHINSILVMDSCMADVSGNRFTGFISESTMKLPVLEKKSIYFCFSLSNCKSHHAPFSRLCIESVNNCSVLGSSDITLSTVDSFSPISSILEDSGHFCIGFRRPSSKAAAMFSK